MLLVIDVGNTNTVLGVFARVAKVHPAGEADETPRYERLVANWRVATSRTSTVDEYGVLFRNLFSMAGLESKGIHGIVISSVVPPLDPVLRQVCERYFNLRPLYIEPGVKTGMPVHYDNPAEVGADRIVNAVAAFEKYGGACVIGSNTVGSLQSGLYYGYLGLVDGILELLLAELGQETSVIATGGLGPMIGTGSKYIKNVDDSLTLEGLRIIWERNGSARKDSTAAKSMPKAASKPPSKSAPPKPAEPKSKNGDRAPATPTSRSAR